MSSPGIVGGAAGLLGAAVSVVSNLRRGDPHWVSTAPDVLTLGIVAALVWFAVWRVVGHNRAQAQRAARHTTVVASTAFAVCMGAFTWWYLPSQALTLATAAALTGFAIVYLVGFAATKALSMRAV